MSKQKKRAGGGGGGGRKEDFVIAHLLPVHAKAPRPNGWLLAVTHESSPPLVLPKVEHALGTGLPAAQRERLAPGVWWLDDERVDLEGLRDGLTEALHALRYQEVSFCDDCVLAEPCGAMGPSSADVHGFAPRPPPAPVLDADAVKQVAELLLVAEEHGGHAFELVAAALSRFCALRPSAVPAAAPTMTVSAALDVLLPDRAVAAAVGRADVDQAYRKAIAAAHPDHGGSAAQVARVMAAKKALDASETFGRE